MCKLSSFYSIYLLLFSFYLNDEKLKNWLLISVKIRLIEPKERERNKLEILLVLFFHLLVEKSSTLFIYLFVCFFFVDENLAYARKKVHSLKLLSLRFYPLDLSDKFVVGRQSRERLKTIKSHYRKLLLFFFLVSSIENCSQKLPNIIFVDSRFLSIFNYYYLIFCLFFY